MSTTDITIKEKLSYGIGAVGKDAACALYYTYLMYYLTDVVQLNVAFVGSLFLFARLWDAINDPMMGWVVDNTKTRWGKFRPWILIGTLVNSIIVLFLFWNPVGHMSETAVYIYCAVFYVLWGMSYTLMDVPYWSMIPSFSSNPDTRDQMSSIPRIGALMGGTVINSFGLAFVAALGIGMGGTESDGWFRLTLCIVVVFILCELICVKNTREHIIIPPKNKIGVKDIFHILKSNDQLLAIIIMTLIGQIAGFLVFGMGLYLFKYIIGNESYFSYFILGSSICGFIGYVLFSRVVKYTSRKIVYSSSIILTIIGNITMFFFATNPETSNPYVVIACACLTGFSGSLNSVSTTVMLADTVDYGEYKTGLRTDSIVFSMQTMTVKAGSALAGFLSGIVLTAVNYVPNIAQSDETLIGLRLCMFILSSILQLIVLFIYLKFYKLHGDYFKSILNQLIINRSKDLAKE